MQIHMAEDTKIFVYRSPVQVRCVEQGTRSQSTGMAQRDGMGSGVGRGFRMGDTWTPMADSCQCMAKPTTILQSN